MKYKHYAPECDVVIADGGNDCKKPPPSPAVNTPAQSFRAKMHHTRNGTNQIPLFGKAACRYRRQDSTADAVRRPFSRTSKRIARHGFDNCGKCPRRGSGACIHESSAPRRRVYGYFRMTAAICRRLFGCVRSRSDAVGVYGIYSCSITKIFNIF